MKVKIKDRIYDSEKEPVMIILSQQDKENICNMTHVAKKYCSYPDSIPAGEICEFMKIDE